jgi:hypothetical protein
MQFGSAAGQCPQFGLDPFDDVIPASGAILPEHPQARIREQNSPIPPPIGRGRAKGANGAKAQA